MGRKPGIKIISKNRRASFDYHLLDRFEAGLVLTGTEIKSVRANQVSLRRGFVQAREGELWLIDANIAPYAHGNRENHEPTRPRKLLLHRREIDKLTALSAERGLALVALRIYWKDNRLKLELGAGKGKGAIDKREDLKKKAMDREMAREMARFNKGKG